MNKKMLSCKKATFLIEKRADNAIGFKEKLSLRLHLLLCKACNIHEKQSQSIAVFLKTFGAKPKKKKLSNTSKSKIINKIKNI